MTDIITPKDNQQGRAQACIECENLRTAENPAGCPGQVVFHSEDCPTDENYIGNGRWE